MRSAADAEARAAHALAQGYFERYPGEASALLETLDLESVAAALRELPSRIAPSVWARLPADRATALLRCYDNAERARVLGVVNPLRAAEMVARLDPDDQRAVLELADAGVAREIQRVLGYPDDSAGRLMDPRVLLLRPAQTVDQVLRMIRLHKPPFTRHLFVVDDDGRLQALVAIQELAVAEREARIADLARPLLASVPFTADREEILDVLERQRLTDLPVVDIGGRLLGVIQHDRLVGTIHEETSADLQMMVGASPDERALSSPLFAVRKRLAWLEINLLTAFLAAAVVGLFESTIAQFTALAVLLPVVAGQSGNAGAQALAVTMRGLALREISIADAWRMARKESLAGFVNGVAIALTTAAGVWLWSGSEGLALVIAIAMVIAMVAAGLSGALIPIGLVAFGQDPAQSSSIVLTTVTDIVGFLSFLGIATMLSGMLV